MVSALVVRDEVDGSTLSDVLVADRLLFGYCAHALLLLLSLANAILLAIGPSILRARMWAGAILLNILNSSRVRTLSKWEPRDLRLP